MSTTTVVPCGCCRDLVEPASAFFDTELGAHVCNPCRKQLLCAKAWLGLPSSAPADGLPAMTIKMHGVYHGADAPDNQPLPPAEPPTT